MNLSNDLVSKFAKMNKEDNKKTSETIVYGTAVAYGDKVYVNLDGSDAVTPVTSTAEVKAGERVTVLLKDHSATILGNISNPSASTETTNKILDEYDVIVAKIGDFELLIADTVTTKKLEAELAVINEALIGKATIADLEAVYAEIENLDVDYINAKIAEIDHALILKADITELDALKANVSNLNADLAEITTLVGGNLTMDNIQSLVLTSSKVTVDNAFIKDAMIDRVSASKLSAGSINTSIVNIGSSDGAMSITGSLQQFKDKDGNVRIQIGKDATGDFTFALYGADGQGQLINQNGITASAIGDGLIVNDMVADNANISGSKLDIDSVVETINDEGTKTISGTKVYLDEQKQSLDVAFKQMHTTIEDDLKEQITTNTTNMEVMQGEINSLISNTTITKEDGVTVNLKDELNAVVNTVDSHSQTISTLETNYNNVSGEMETVNSTVSKMEQDLEGFEQSITTTVTGLETRVQSAEQKMTTEGIISIVTSSTEWADQANTVSGFQSSINQNADKISWMIKSGTSASNMQLTDKMLTIIADNIDLTGKVTFNSFDNTVITEIEDLTTYAVNNTTIYGNQIATGTITASHIASSSIQAHHIDGYAITADQIAGNTITSAEIAAGAISTSELAAGAVTADKIAAHSITVDKISNNNRTAPVITLFDHCEIDASKLNGEGVGSAIRFKWDDDNYVYQGKNLFALFQSSGGESKILSINADSNGTKIYNKDNYALALDSSLLYRGATVITSSNYTSYCAKASHGTHVSFGGNGSASTCARSDHSHSGYASSSHTHDIIYYNDTSNRVEVYDGYIYFKADAANMRFDCGASGYGWAYKLAPTLGGVDLGNSGDWQRWRTLYIQSIDQSSDIKYKENIMYLDEIVTYDLRDDNSTPFLDFIKNEFKPALYDYKIIREEEGRRTNDSQLGFIANDIINTEVGQTFLYDSGTEEETNLSFSTTGYTTVVARALQEEIRVRDDQIAMLENMIINLEERLSALENKQ